MKLHLVVMLNTDEKVHESIVYADAFLSEESRDKGIITTAQEFAEGVDFITTLKEAMEFLNEINIFVDVSETEVK